MSKSQNNNSGSSFHQLMSLLHSEFERIKEESSTENQRRHLVDILADGINKSLKEIRQGGEVYEFKESAVIHTIVDGSREGYTGHELREFVRMLADGDPDFVEYDDDSEEL